jgi:DNA-binding transcriptional regulator YiaG
MNISYLENIRRVLAFCSIRLTVRRIPYPAHWRSRQQIPGAPECLGAQIRRQRRELRLFQDDLAKALGVSVFIVSNWERGVNQPSRRTRKRLRDYLELRGNHIARVEL